MNSFAPPADLPSWWAGVDGGGSGTRLRLQDSGGRTRGEGQAGPSALSQGADQAWRHVLQALAAATAAAGLGDQPLAPARVALGLGLAGAGIAAWRAAFAAADPGFAVVRLFTDAETQLAGAHAGAPGIVVAAGTGSVAAARHADGRLQLAGGWGFPVGDEGSGAWLGLQAARHAQQVLDGRAAASPLSAAVGASLGSDVPALQAWAARTAGAGAAACARLAPLVFDAAAEGCTVAAALLQRAADDLAAHVPALQGSGPPLPVVMRGSVGVALLSRWPAALQARVLPPRGDSADGALQLLRQQMSPTPTARPRAGAAAPT